LAANYRQNGRRNGSFRPLADRWLACMARIGGVSGFAKRRPSC